MDDFQVIDTHIHVWTAGDPAFPMHIPPEKYPWWRGTTAEYIAEMEAAGISRAVIVQIPYHEYDHSYALEARRQYPHRFAIVGLLDVHHADAPRTLRRMVNEDDIQGLRFSPGSGDWLDAAPAVEVARTAGELGVPIIVQTGPSHYERVGRLASLAGDTRFALDHVGGVGFDSRAGDDFERLLRLSKHENVYVKTSHLYGLDRSPQEEAAIPAALERLRDGYGADRLMFGSNWPLVRSFAGLKRSVDGFKSAIASFPRPDAQAILCRTAEKLYRWSR